MSTLRRAFLLCLFAMALPASLCAQPVDVAGVKYEPTAQLGGARLLLNGAGIRYKFVIKVYTAGLYLGAKAATPDAVYAAQGPRRMHVVMLRDIDANELGKLFTDGMKKNSTREQFAKVIPGTVALGELFSARKKLVAGDSFSVDYLPGTGTTIVINGKGANEPIKEPEFFNALMRIWLGDSPADYQLKDALLGVQQ